MVNKVRMMMIINFKDLDFTFTCLYFVSASVIACVGEPNKNYLVVIFRASATF